MCFFLAVINRNELEATPRSSDMNKTTGNDGKLNMLSYRVTVDLIRHSRR